MPVAHRLASVVGNAGVFLALVDGTPALRSDDEGVLGPGIGIGSMAWIVVAREAVVMLVEQFHIEMEGRMQLEVAPSHTCLAENQVPYMYLMACRYCIYLAWTWCALWRVIGAHATLQNLKGLQRWLAEKIALSGLANEMARHWQVKKAASHGK